MRTPRSPTRDACGTQLARTVDVVTLDEWLDRSARYDVALRDLYAALVDSDGRVTTPFARR